ncbi:hypothetical protein [Streptomyces broussonetiae]|uniref:Uncharacterized protein n=1 Tax=Streptomyces broussonetiae TaxID=2686304 RepID=A0ABV5E5J5_9ACTN
MAKYRNENTSDEVEYEHPSPRLEMLPNWTRLDPQAEEPKEPSAEQQTEPPEPVERPAKNAAKEAWQEYARTRVQDADEAAEIDSLTKEQLIKQYGGDD